LPTVIVNYPVSRKRIGLAVPYERRRERVKNGLAVARARNPTAWAVTGGTNKRANSES
jgi:hypothetical protein